MISKVLLVQRDDSSRKAIAECLGQHEFEVDAVSNGELAIWKLFHKRTHVDLLIYDFNLPHEDRIKTAVALRSNHRVIPIIVLTDFPSITADKALFRGPVEFLQKPFSDGELVGALRRLLARLCRRTNESQTWHLCVNCKDWPIADYDEQQLSPSLELQLCDDCRLDIQQRICL